MSTKDRKARNKRQYQTARNLGLSSKEAKKYYSYGKEKYQAEIKKLRYQVNKEKYNSARREKYHTAREKGLTSDQAKSYRSRKQSELEKATPEIARQKEYLVCAYREFTHGDDPEAYYTMKEMNRVISSEKLLEGIKSEMLDGQIKGGFIGDYRIDIVEGSEELHNLKELYKDTMYIPIYVGEGKSYQALLSLVLLAVSIMYHDMCKFFILELIENLRLLHNEKAHKNADRLYADMIPIIRGRDMI